MIEKGRISGLQMAILIHPTIMATAILLVPALTSKSAKQDMWLSPIWASAVGILTIFITHQLHKKYPGKTIIQYSKEIIGSLPGKVIGSVFLFFFLHINGITLREYGEFILGNFLPKTPPVVVIGSMVIVSGLAVRGGIEVIARTAEIFVPVVSLLLFLIGLLLLPDLDPRKVLPIMEHGILPSLEGAIVPSSWFAEFFLLSFLFPLLGKKEKGFKWGIVALTAVVVMMVITNLYTYFLFGNITPYFVYPVMSATQYISIVGFLEHLESIVMAVWVAGTFIKISVFYYVLVIGSAQWFGLTNYKPIVFPTGLLLVIFSLWSTSTLDELTHFLSTSGAFYLITIQTVLPAALLMVAFLRKKKKA